MLSSLDIEIIHSDYRTSDYIKCKATKKVFNHIFKTKLKWRTVKIGSWELQTDGTLPEDLKAKQLLLRRNVLFPKDFIKNWIIDGQIEKR